MNLIDQNTKPVTEQSMNTNKHANTLKIALDIGLQIAADAVWHEDRCNWVGQRYDHHGTGQPALIESNLNSSFYNGTAGIAHFFKSLYALHADPILKSTALGAIRHALQKVASAPDFTMHSFWTGRLGVALVSLDLGIFFNDKSLIKKAKHILQNIFNKEITSESGLDILDGCAGAITSILSYKHLLPKEQTEEIRSYVNRLSEHIISKGNFEDNKVSWSTGEEQSQPLLGYAHGTSGYAHALIEAGVFLDKPQFVHVGLQAINYENDHFDADEKNWPDYRKQPNASENKSSFMNAWCHGAMGIGLSRLRCYELLEMDIHLEDITHCLSHYQHQHPVELTSACQCHGSSGNVELLMYADKILDDRDFSEIIDKSLRDMSDHHHSTKPWLNGLSNYCQIPGLMDGLAGVGYFFLRQCDPDKIPNLLLMTDR